MSNDNPDQPKKRQANVKYKFSYSRMTIEDTEERLGFMIAPFISQSVPVSRMLAEVKGGTEGLGKDVGNDTILKTKGKVYKRIVDYLDSEGYPTETEPDFKEANISDLVYSIINPIIRYTKRKTGRYIRLRREKEIVSKDGETGGFEEFVIMDYIAIKNKKFVLIVEAKRSSAGEAMKQCLLSLKDAWDNNGGGTIYGFITTGEQWQMLCYDGSSFILTEKMIVMFPAMEREKERWMKDYSDIVDCISLALSNGGIAKKDVVVG